MFYPQPVVQLINELTKLPGVGPKTAQRLALHLVGLSQEEVERLTGAILEARERTTHCTTCFNITDVDPCRICRDPSRDRSLLCVVEEPKDVVALERTHEYRGLYHVLQGAISPMEGVGPNDIRLKELLPRLEGGEVREVILATSSSVEGEATAMYVARLVKPLGIKVTRIAYGLPVGGNLEYVDELTLTRALQGRREF
ncbi:MAG: recombination mediator RecR [Bacillota bacterium]|nr:recombination mediator RecR [Bacillota bacterium]